MKTLCFVLFVAGASCVYIEESGVPDKNFAKIEDVPYQAKIMVSSPLYNNCGAVIIAKFWLLTCVHCVDDEMNVIVETGTSYRNVSGTLHKVEKIIMHPNYTIRNNDNDIALIKLVKPIKFNKVQSSIAIANPTDIPKEGKQMLISGYGLTGRHSKVSSILKSAYVPVGNTENCAKAYASTPITDNMFCAGDGQADSCKGDSGGPAVIDDKLYGIIIGGTGCGSKKYPGIYASMYKYYDWIVNTTGLDL